MSTSLPVASKVHTTSTKWRPAAEPVERESWWDRWHLMAAAVATWILLFTAASLDHLTNIPHQVILALYVGAYASGGITAAIQAGRDLLHRQVNVDLLMVTAAVGAACVNAWGEGAVLLALFSTSNALEHAAMERTRNAIRALMDLSPETATVVRGGREEVIPVSELLLGDHVLVRPGERVPVDGVVIDGATAIDQSAITGESVPVSRAAGDTVFTSTINQRGAITVEVQKLAHESTLARIIAFVESAREQKSRTQRFTDAFEGRYAIGVIAAAALTFLIPWAMGQEAASSFYRAMTLLVVASPCALVISTPASTLSALANAARNGILFKGGNHLEQIATIRTFAFDKTGTLTTGHQRVTDVLAITTEISVDEVLGYAAVAERRSEHHVARAIVEEAQNRSVTIMEPEAFESHPGKGVTATFAGKRIWVGNEYMAQGMGADPAHALSFIASLRRDGKSAVFVGAASTVVGVIAVADTVRDEARATVAAIQDAGVERIVMLTGDNATVAEAIGRQVGITDVRASLLPEEKLTIIRSLTQEGTVAMVGDGVNDAPALATADLGIAMGGAGTDVALETADVVLMNDNLRSLAYGVELGRRTRRTIIQNLAFSLTVIVVLVTCSLTIGIPLPLGVVGHEGSTILVVLNGLRLLRTPRHPLATTPR